ALIDSHLEDIADRFSLESDFEGLPVIPLAAAYVASDMKVGEVVHQDLALAEALAGFAAPPLGVEAEPAGAVATDLGLAGHRKHTPYLVKQAGGRGPRPARAAADRALIDLHELVDRLEPHDALPTSDAGAR